MAERSSASGNGSGKTKHRRSLSQPAEPGHVSHHGAKPRLELHASPVRLADAYHDSPMFRKSLLKEEEQATEMGATLKAYAKTLRTVQSSGIAHGQVISAMTTEAQLLIRRHPSTMESTSSSHEPSDFDNHIQDFINAVQLGENLRVELHKKFEETVIRPMEALQDELAKAKESMRKWQRLTSLTDSSAIKVAGLKKNSNKLDEAEAELADLKAQTATAAIEVGTALNAHFARRRLAVLDSACAMLDLQSEFLGKYQAIVKDTLPQLKACRARIREESEEVPRALQRVPLNVLQDPSHIGYLQGYLYRKTKMNFTRRDYFILESGVLSCYENLDSSEPKWKLDMLTCTVKPSADASRNFCFDIICPTKSRTLQADSQETMNRWITAIQEAISAQLDKQRIGRPGRRGSNAVTPSSSSLEASEELKKREEAIASLYTADAGNKLCADCGDLNPTWISINLGILICLECSGIHRSMGTHISKVRSLTLDTLHPETKKYIVALGNRRINEIFGPDILTAIPNSFGERLNPNSTRKDREAWIKAKYGEKIFVETYRGQNIQNDFVASIRQQDVPRCMLLYAQGANLNFKYESDAARSPLHYSADGSSPLVCMFLLQNGAHVNAKDSNGTTPLHVAAASGHVACAAVLCKWRAKVDSSDIQGKTALDVALETQNADAITLLRLAKLVREGGGLDDKSFSEALDSFSADLQSTPTKTSDHLSANGPSKLRASSPGRKSSSSAASSTSTSNVSSSASSNATSPAIAVNGVSAAHHHSSTTSAGVGSSLSPPKGSAVLSTSAPSTASSFSFLSKLDRKKS